MCRIHSCKGSWYSTTQAPDIKDGMEHFSFTRLLVLSYLFVLISWTFPGAKRTYDASIP